METKEMDQKLMEHLKELKEFLLVEIEGKACWRMQKASEYPEDAVRNTNSANELDKLHAYVDALPSDHLLFRAMQKAYATDASEVIAEYENGLLSRYGFDNEPGEDPDAFIKRLIVLYRDRS